MSAYQPKTGTHTPGPWEVMPRTKDQLQIVGPRKGTAHEIIVRTPDEYRQDHAVWEHVSANAQHIVRCVNSHDAMLEALKGLYAYALHEIPDMSEFSGDLEQARLMKDARLAIAQAEGRTTT